MKKIHWFVSGIMLILLSWTAPVQSAGAITLTPEQQQKLAGMSAQQKAELARQAGIALPAAAVKTNENTAKPVVIKAREAGSSNLEQQRKPKPADSEKFSLNGGEQPRMPGQCKSMLDAQGRMKLVTQCQSKLDDTGQIVWLAQGQPVLSSECKPMMNAQGKPVMGAGDKPLLFAECQSVLNAFADFTRDAKPLTVDANLKQFGYELFAGSPDTFAPATEVPVPAEYVLGPGDELNIHLYGREDQDLVLVVDREGEIAFPSLGPLSVAGMRFNEAKAFIAEQVKEKLVGVTADISMGKLRSIRIFALGEVERPGSYTVSGLSTISNALFVSGGIKKTGSLRHIQLKRNGRVMAEIDLYDFLLRGNTSDDERLLPGDVVFVPPIGKTASIAGQVVRPAIYELKRERSVGDLIRLAGGLLPTAYKKMALIERIAASGGRSEVKVSLSKRKPATMLKNGDLLKVFSVTDYENNPVWLLGHVKRPGKYAWRKGMRLKDILPSADMLLPEAKLDYGVIERESGVNRETSIVHFNVLDAINGKQSVPLQARDKVYVFKRAQMREMPTVQITGSVQKPGKYEAKKNMRLWDLVMAAGGLMRDAMMDDVELYRIDPLSKEATLQSFDLEQALKGDKRNNPQLQDQDRVVVHSVWEVKKRYKVSVNGEVNHPGEFTLTAGMRMTDLLFAAGNVTERAYMQKAEITRYTVENNRRRVSKHIQVNLAKALGGDRDANIPLQPYDVLTVRRMSNWRDIEHASIEGEVNFPGSYPIEEGERLSSLLQRAGGFTSKAYLAAAVFTRVSIRQQQQKQLDELSKQMQADIERQEASIANIKDPSILKREKQDLDKARAVLKQMSAAKATGRLVIRLADMAHFKGGEFDLRLRDGDKLMVPQQPDQVLVLGQVYNQAALLYRRDFSPDDYVELAGGVKRFADTDRIYVIRANGEVDARHSAWLRKRVYPGDTIVVPQDLEQFHLIDSMLDWSRVAANVGLTIASFRAVGIL